MYKTNEERKIEINEIITTLTNLELTIQYDEIKKLFILMKTFLKEGNKIKVNIPK